MLKLNELIVGKEYKITNPDNSIEKFTYLGLDDDLLGEHNVLLEDGTKSFLIEGDKVGGLE